MAGVSTSQGHTNYSRGWYKAKVGILLCPSGIRCSRIYRNFFILLDMRFFFKKKHHDWFSFLKTQGSPLWIWKNIFFQISLNHFSIKTIGLHLVSRFLNGIHLDIGNIFCKYIFKKYFKKYFHKNIYKKYFQNPSVISFWNCETKCNAMTLIKKWFEAIWKKIFFQIQRGDPCVFKNKNRPWPIK